MRFGLFRDKKGSIALKFALCAPILCLIAAGAVDISAVVGDRQKLNDIAESSALAGAQELNLAVDQSNAAARAKAFAEAHISEWPRAPAITVTSEVVTFEDGQPAVHVTLRADRPSFFGNLLPPGGWHTKGEATAERIGSTPLCVLAFGSLLNKSVSLQGSSRIQAPVCMVHSNQDIVVMNNAKLEAAETQAVGSAKGYISPAPATGAKTIDDPFADLKLAAPKLCNLKGLPPQLLTGGVLTLQPGVHCATIIASNDAVIRLAPGEHWFLASNLVMQGQSRLEGEDVVVVFDKLSNFQFLQNSMVNLKGRKDGAFAGFVVVATRDNLQPFSISSDHVDTLLGVVYIPSATLSVSGFDPVAKDSAWTVIVARSLVLSGRPSLMINADYGSGGIPVPGGVGPGQGGSRLVH